MPLQKAKSERSLRKSLFKKKKKKKDDNDEASTGGMSTSSTRSFLWRRSKNSETTKKKKRFSLRRRRRRQKDEEGSIASMSEKDAISLPMTGSSELMNDVQVDLQAWLHPAPTAADGELLETALSSETHSTWSHSVANERNDTIAEAASFERTYAYLEEVDEGDDDNIEEDCVERTCLQAIDEKVKHSSEEQCEAGNVSEENGANNSGGVDVLVAGVEEQSTDSIQQDRLAQDRSCEATKLSQKDDAARVIVGVSSASNVNPTKEYAIGTDAVSKAEESYSRHTVDTITTTDTKNDIAKIVDETRCILKDPTLEVANTKAGGLLSDKPTTVADDSKNPLTHKPAQNDTCATAAEDAVASNNAVVKSKLKESEIGILQDATPVANRAEPTSAFVDDMARVSKVVSHEAVVSKSVAMEASAQNDARANEKKTTLPLPSRDTTTDENIVSGVASVSKSMDVSQPKEAADVVDALDVSEVKLGVDYNQVSGSKNADILRGAVPKDTTATHQKKNAQKNTNLTMKQDVSVPKVSTARPAMVGKNPTNGGAVESDRARAGASTSGDEETPMKHAKNELDPTVVAEDPVEDVATVSIGESQSNNVHAVDTIVVSTAQDGFIGRERIPSKARRYLLAVLLVAVLLSILALVTTNKHAQITRQVTTQIQALHTQHVLPLQENAMERVQVFHYSLCAPIQPGSVLLSSTEHTPPADEVDFVAPWWVSSQEYKSIAFEWLCPGRSQTQLKVAKRQVQIFIVKTGAMVWESKRRRRGGVVAVRIEADRLIQGDNEAQAPWSVAETKES